MSVRYFVFLVLSHQDMAQRAVVSYVRSVFLQPNRAVFDVTALPLPEYSSAMGLLAAPKLRFLKRQAGAKASVGGAAAAAAQPAAAAAEESSDDGESGEEQAASPASSPEPEAAAAASGAGRDGNAGAAGLVAAPALLGGDDGDAGDDDLLVVKRRDVLGTEAAAAAAQQQDSLEQHQPEKRKKKKKLRIQPDAPSGANRVVFDEEGRAREPLEMLAADLDRYDGSLFRRKHQATVNACGCDSCLVWVAGANLPSSALRRCGVHREMLQRFMTFLCRPSA